MRTPFELTDHELWVLAARDGARESAMIASWILPGTLAPERPRVVAVLSRANLTTELALASGRFALELLAEGQAALVPELGLVSGRERDKLAGRVAARTPGGLPLLGGTCGWIEAAIAGALDCGDRIVAVADVLAAEVVPGRAPLRKRAAFAALPPATARALAEKARLDGLRDAGRLRAPRPLAAGPGALAGGLR